MLLSFSATLGGASTAVIREPRHRPLLLVSYRTVRIRELPPPADWPGRSDRVPRLYPCRYAQEKLSVRESDRPCPLLAFCPRRISIGRVHHHRKRMNSIRRFRTKLTFRRNILLCCISFEWSCCHYSLRRWGGFHWRDTRAAAPAAASSLLSYCQNPGASPPSRLAGALAHTASSDRDPMVVNR